MHINITYNFLPKTPTIKAIELQQLFGINFDQGEHTLINNFELQLQPGQLILITGDSGSGKSSLLHHIAQSIGYAVRTNSSLPPLPPGEGRGEGTTSPHIISLSNLTPDHRIILEQIKLPLNDTINLLSQCGLAEPRLMLRTPTELSDGQRYRFLLALAISQNPDWIIADEFCANLDRTLAKVLSFNLHKLCKKTHIGFILATTHQDLLEDLSPDQHIICQLDQQPKIVTFSNDSRATLSGATGYASALQDMELKSTPVGYAVRTIKSESTSKTIAHRVSKCDNQQKSRMAGVEASRAPSTIDQQPKPVVYTPRTNPYLPPLPPGEGRGEGTVKKKSPSPTTSGSPQVPSPIGRISLGGITAATTSASPVSSPSSGTT